MSDDTEPKSDESVTDADAAPKRSVGEKARADVGIIHSGSSEVRELFANFDRVRSYTENGYKVRGGFFREARIASIECGSQFARHRNGLEFLIQEHAPRWLIAVGFSVACDDTIPIGDIVLANRIRDTHGNKIDVDCRIPAKGRVHVGTHIVPDEMPLTASARAQLVADHLPEGDESAIAIDTVSFGSARMAAEAKVPFLSVRAVLAEAGENLNEDLAAALSGVQIRRVGALLGTVFRSPKKAVNRAWKSHERVHEAGENLAKFTENIIKRLCDL